MGSCISKLCCKTTNFEQRFVATTNFEQRFALGTKVGSGHFADVHICIDKTTNKQYAVKIINKTTLVNSELLQEEVNILRKVGEHENVASIYIETYNSAVSFLIVFYVDNRGQQKNKNSWK